MAEAVNRAYHDGIIILDMHDRYKQMFDVGGYPVVVGGRIVNGVARIGSAWIRSPSNGDDDA